MEEGKMNVRGHGISSSGHHPLKLFFNVLNLSIISLGDASGPIFVAALHIIM